MRGWSRRAGIVLGARERAAFDEVCLQQGVPVRLVEELIESEVSDRRNKSGPVSELVRQYCKGPPRTEGLKESQTIQDDQDGAYRLSRLQLMNFGPFVDAQLDLQWNPEQPLVLIEGNNGYGKTRLIEGVRFLLYGMERSADPVNMLNRDAEKPRARMEVLLDLTTPEGETTRLRRLVEFVMLLGAWKVERQAFVVKAGSRALQDDEAQEWVDARLPRNVMECFVFDAENSPVASLAAGADNSGVAEQLERVLGVTVLHTVARRVSDLEKQLRNELEAKAGGPSIRQVQASIEEVDAGLEKVERDMADEKSRLARLNEERSRVAGDLDKLLAHFDPATEEARARRLERRSVLQRKEQELRQAVSDSAGTTLPVQLLDQHIAFVLDRSRDALLDGETRAYRQGMEQAARTVARAASDGTLPWGEVPRPSMQRILEKLHEVLDLSESEDDDQYSLPETAIKELQEALAEARSQPVPALVIRELRTLREELAGLSSTPVQESAAPHDVVRQHSRLLSEQSDLDRQIARRDLNLEGLRRQLKELEERREQRRKALSTAETEGKAQETLRSLCDFAATVGRCIKTLAARLRGLRVDELERGTTEMFTRTTNKPELYAQVIFDRDTLRYHVADRDGNEAPLDRSTGERAILSLAVVHGLRRASGRSLPLLVEAPLKPLDPIHTENVIRHAFQATSGQTILLVKPGEVPDSHRARLLARVGQRFVLTRPDPRREWSTVTEVKE